MRRTSVVWFSKLARRPVPERVAGADLFEHLVGAAAADGTSVYFLGAQPHVVERVVEIFTQRWPDLRVAGFHDGFWSDDAEVVAAIREMLLKKHKVDVKPSDVRSSLAEAGFDASLIARNVAGLRKIIDPESDLIHTWKWVHQDRLCSHFFHGRFVEYEFIFHRFIGFDIRESFFLDASHIDHITIREDLIGECITEIIPFFHIFLRKVQILGCDERE